MSDFVTVKVLGNHTVHHSPDPEKPEEVKTSADAPFKMRVEQFAELGPEGLRAVRKAGKDDREPVTPPAAGGPGVGQGGVRTSRYSVEELAAFAPKHRGAGKFDVVNGEVLVQGGFDSKDAAEGWIVEQRKALSE